MKSFIYAKTTKTLTTTTTILMSLPPCSYPRNKYLLNYSAYGANQLWQTLPFEIKDCASLQLFKDKIKTWLCDRCQCQICSRYIANAGYF